ncbi:unnamed protein product [Pieris macdunnoughi]|uniref:Uncharacterized protein n=1 Tax=Pieris macdunnoughi TaxID=345717 RepID=A0A821T943_9NEOP|nr:unnamed protein product [Pieris macdunnoughi]
MDKEGDGVRDEKRNKGMQLIMMGKTQGKRRADTRKKTWLLNVRGWTGITSARDLFRLEQDTWQFVNNQPTFSDKVAPEEEDYTEY